MGVMIVTLICGIAITRCILTEHGERAFAAYSLLATLPSLINFPDFGTGAEVVNKVARADDPDRDDDVRRTALSVQRILLIFGTGTVLVTGILLVTGRWSWVLGSSLDVSGIEIGATSAMALFALAACLGLGTRMLLGLQKQHWIVAVQGVQSPVALLSLLLMGWLWSSAPDGAAVVVPYIGMCAVAAMMSLVAGRYLKQTYRFVRKAVFQLRVHPGARVMHVGAPSLLQIMVAPVALQSHRLIIAHGGASSALPEYSVAAQVFLAIMGVVSAAGLALWPMFARRAAEGVPIRPVVIAAAFGAFSMFACGLILLLREPIFRIVTGGELTPSLAVCLGFTAYLVTQSFLYPLGMSLMDPAGIRFQVVPILLMTTASVLGSIVLVNVLGIAGPLLATALAVLLFQVAPFYLRVRRVHG